MSDVKIVRRYVGGDNFCYTLMLEPDDELDAPIDLTVEEVADYEDVTRRYYEWRERLGNHSNEVLAAKRAECTRWRCNRCGIKRGMWQAEGDTRCPDHAIPFERCSGTLEQK